MYSSSVGRHVLLLDVSCSALSVARHPALLLGKIPALLLGFSLVVYPEMFDLQTQLNKNRIPARSIYGSRGHAPARQDDYQAWLEQKGPGTNIRPDAN